MLRDFLRHAAGHEQVEVSDGFRAAPEAPGGCDALDAATLGEIRAQFRCEAVGDVDHEAAGAAPESFDGFHDFLFELLAHARQLAQLAFSGKRFDLIERRDFVIG